MFEPQHTVNTVPASGAGRTPALHALVTTARAAGTEVWLTDPGERHHDLADHVDRHGAGVPGSIALLEAAAALIRERQDAAFAEGAHSSEPAVRVLVTDLPAMIQRPEVAELLERILRTGRKAGVLETVIEETGRDAFPGHPYLRGQFATLRSSGC
ncbi:hypothetical protein P3T36_006352 [Kitasatospora sp. MAP12-15]|uniref:hypothetical protein n=1 Tax=unclassified Kitasatospora TaxID=2633591 RepID=UPI002475AF33|nr:hypothetical protein [Kitasatospora sp. MAP12-44]MDH6107893.1 hypothetical protein [Kitasatospora sp. MAP12-44]